MLDQLILIIVDAGTKFIEAHTLTSATSENTIEKLRQTFATHGFPQSIVSDNGTPFKSEIFSEFCKLNGIRQIFVSPYRPASNGMAERAVQVVKNGLKKTKETNESLETRLYRYLLHYNKIPQSATGTPPCQLLMKRTIRSRIDVIKPDLKEKVQDKQMDMKNRHDQRSKVRSLYAGDRVYARFMPF